MSYAAILARFAGICACGGTVGPNDAIRYDRDTKKIIACYGCTENVLGGHAWKLKGVSVDESANTTRRARAAALVNARASVARLSARLAATSTDNPSHARYERWLGNARNELAQAETNALGERGEPRWARPSARDIELAEARRQRDAERRRREDEEEANA